MKPTPHRAPSLHQLVAGFRPHDAISDEAMAFRAIFREWGCASEIFAEPNRVAPELRRQAGNARDWASRASPEDAVLLHLSIGSDVNDLFASLPCRKAILYHNVTPPRYFRLLSPPTARDLERGRRQAAALAGTADVTIADSAFNAAELTELGYGNVRVLPLLLAPEKLRGRADADTLRRYDDGMINVLFVGRGAPNKRLEHGLQAFAFFQKACGRPARFIHAGTFGGMERYRTMLAALARELGVEHAVFTGPVSQPCLNALYERADLFLCMSEHEGFCTPLIEAMARDVPVLARAAGAVPETMDGAGILLDNLNFAAIGEIMARVCADETLRAALIEGQRERMRRHAAKDLASDLRAHLEPLLKSRAAAE